MNNSVILFVFFFIFFIATAFVCCIASSLKENSSEHSLKKIFIEDYEDDFRSEVRTGWLTGKFIKIGKRFINFFKISVSGKIKAIAAVTVSLAVASGVFILLMPKKDIIEQADLMASHYDYEGAVELVENAMSKGLLLRYGKYRSCLNRYRKEMALLEEVDVSKVPHIFFHSLINDTSLAFDGDDDSEGYNAYMTTKREFREILHQLYRNDYVLVREHDIAVKTENGFEAGKIYLPKGKKALIISQDDVNYYEYMKGDGFAEKLFISDDGKVKCEYLNEGSDISGSGNGNNDLIPILDAFVEKYPDFSYKGAKAVIAVTGYEGVFGYHNVCEEKYGTGEYEQEAQQVRLIAEKLVESGYELASHSYGHIHFDDEEETSLDDIKEDTDDWEKYIENALGQEVDIFIYPHGGDIVASGDSYHGNDRFKVLYDAGFRYFLNVDSTHNSWIDIEDDYVRQARRDIDGYMLYSSYNDMKDLFYEPEMILDVARPVPIEAAQ